MGYIPCAVDHRMFTGRGVSTYPAILSGMHELRKKRRLCPNHWTMTKAWIDRYLDQIIDGQEWTDEPETVCSVCGKKFPVDSLASIFVTWYEGKADRADAFGRVCEAHYDDAAFALNLAEQQTLLESH